MQTVQGLVDVCTALTVEHPDPTHYPLFYHWRLPWLLGSFQLLFLCSFASRLCLTWVKSLIPFIRDSLRGGMENIIGELCTIHWPRQRLLGRRAW